MGKSEKDLMETLLKYRNSNIIWKESEEEKVGSEILMRYGWDAFCDYIGEDARPVEVKIEEAQAKKKARP